MSCGGNYVNPVVLPARYVVQDFYTPRAVPVIQPVVTVNRQNIVDVPQPYIQPMTTNVVVAPQAGFGTFGGVGGVGAAGGFLGRRF